MDICIKKNIMFINVTQFIFFFTGGGGGALGVQLNELLYVVSFLRALLNQTFLFLCFQFLCFFTVQLFSRGTVVASLARALPRVKYTCNRFCTHSGKDTTVLTQICHFCFNLPKSRAVTLCVLASEEVTQRTRITNLLIYLKIGYSSTKRWLART